MEPFKRYEQLSEFVKMYPCLYIKQENDFKKEVKQTAWKEIAKELDLENAKVVEQHDAHFFSLKKIELWSKARGYELDDAARDGVVLMTKFHVSLF